MERFSLPGDIAALDFLMIAGFFLATMTAFFNLKAPRYRWLNVAFLITFALNWALIVFASKPLATKMFATLLLISVVTIEFVVSKRRRESDERPSGGRTA